MDGQPRTSHTTLPLLVAWALLAGGATSARAASWVTITEIHYHPPEGDALEFLEILCREPPRVDLGDWTLEGEVRFRFPRDTVLLEGERIVVARSPRHLRELYPSLTRVAGPFSGKLDNKGGRVALRNAAGALVCEVVYARDGGWPAVADGTGHTLSLRDPYLDAARPENWAASPFRGGTPGRENGFLENVEGTPLVRKGATWRFLRGRAAPPAGWRDLDFDDSRWEAGPSGLGYGDGDDETVISDMQGSYLSLYARHAFEVPSPAALDRLVVRVDYDDGFILTLNGKEVAREQMGPARTPVAHDAPSLGRHEAGVPAEYALGPAAALLRPGRNVLAVEVHNDDRDSSDLTILVELESRSGRRRSALREPLLNEVLLAPAAASFVEIYNPGAAPYSLAGHFLSDDPLKPGKYRLGEVTVPPFGFHVLGGAELGGLLRLQGPRVQILLVSPDGRRVLDTLRVETGGSGEEAAGDSGTASGGAPEATGADQRAKQGEPAAPPRPGPEVARGRSPDAGADIAVLARPTPGAPNERRQAARLVISEIMYHPISEDEADEYLEITNRGGEETPLAGCRLRGGVRYDFQPGESIGPGGYLVVARDPEALAAKYRLGRAAVAGPYRGRLSNRGDRLVLLDPLGEVVDRVEYSDRDPWPVWADGLGSSLELVHPDLDNSIAGSWAASDDRSKARWQRITYVKEHRLLGNPSARVLPELQFMLLNEGECLIDDVHLGARRELVADGSFRRGGADWQALGTHERSAVARDEGAKTFYRIVAEGRGDPRNNYVTLSIPGGLQEGQRYRIAFRARWQRGSRMLLTRTAGQGVARAHRLDVPEHLGSPGARSTIDSASPPPAIGRPEQFPVAPADDEPVTVIARISSLGKLASANLHYRRTGESRWSTVPLADRGRAGDGAAGDGLFAATIPPQPAGVVEFTITARDEAGREGSYPHDAPARTALYAVGLLANDRLPTLTLLVSDSEWRELQSRPLLSNRLADGTLVYGDSRLFYNVGFRPRGSPFTRRQLQYNYNWRIAFGSENLDGRRTLTIDGQGGDGTRLNERLTFWLIDRLGAPNSRQQYVYFRLQGAESYEQGIYEDVEKIDGAFLESWIDGNPRVRAAGKALAAARGARSAAGRGQRRKLTEGILHKIDDYFEVFPGGQREQLGEAFLRFTSRDPEDYRWYFPLRANGASENYEPLVDLAFLMDPRATPDSRFLATVEEVVDVDEWLQVLAARAVVNDWDSFGRERGKNALLYLSPADGRWRLLPWDADLSWGQGRGAPALIGAKFPSIERLLSHPPYKVRYYGYLAYIAERLFEPGFFEAIAGDLERRSGARYDGFLEFARLRRQEVLEAIGREVAAVPFRVERTARVARAGEPDLLRASGLAPLLAERLLLDGREGEVRFQGQRWLAEFPLGPDGGQALLAALDLGGREVGRAAVSVSARAGATPLAAPEKEPEPALVARVEPVPLAGGGPEGGGALPSGPLSPEAGGALERVKPEEPREAREPAGGAAERVVLELAALDGSGREAARRGGGNPGEDAPPGAAGAVPGEALDLFGRPGAGRAQREPPPPALAGARAGSQETSERRARRVRRSRPAPPAAPGPGAGPERRDEWREPHGLAAGAAGAAGGAEGGGAPAVPLWAYLAGIFAVLGLLQAAVLVAVRRRSAAGAAGGPREAPRSPLAVPAAAGEVAPARRAEHSPLAVSLRNLGSENFTLAAAGLQHLWKEAELDVPALIGALDDRRPTPFLKVRRTRQGLRAVPAGGLGKIRVRHVAALLLELKLGRPPGGGRPAKAEWLVHWRRLEGGEAAARGS